MTIASADELELLRARFERLARVECAERSPLWGEVCLAVAGDDDVLELMLCAPPHQRRPTLLLAAIHDLLLAGTRHALAAHVPTVAARGAIASGRAGELALAFCREHRDALAQILATRSTQTNEVNRCAALLPALAHATPPGRPLRLVELGASAGLNLLMDRFAYRYDRLDIVGSQAAGVVCACSVDGRLPPLALPRITGRVGVDLFPIDVRDDGAARWLLACVWPDEADRVARLRAAIALAREELPTIVHGDALETLDEVVGADRGGGAHLVIWHSWALAYWSVAKQRALGGAIADLGAHRDLTWLYLEQHSETPGLPTPVVAGVVHRPEDSALVAVSYRSGERVIERLADAHPHAHNLRWFARRG